MFLRRLMARRAWWCARRTPGASRKTGDRRGRAPGAEHGQHDSSHLGHSSWIPGVWGFNVVRAGPCLFQPMENEGLQGGKRDHHEGGRPRPLHAPGIPQARFAM